MVSQLSDFWGWCTRNLILVCSSSAWCLSSFILVFCSLDFVFFFVFSDHHRPSSTIIDHHRPSSTIIPAEFRDFAHQKSSLLFLPTTSFHACEIHSVNSSDSLTLFPGQVHQNEVQHINFSVSYLGNFWISRWSFGTLDENSNHNTSPVRNSIYFSQPQSSPHPPQSWRLLSSFLFCLIFVGESEPFWFNKIKLLPKITNDKKAPVIFPDFFPVC